MPATALAVAVDMPELGTLTKAQAASLAPVARQSGGTSGQAHVRDGRPALRRALYMPALVAMRFNAGLRAKAERLAGRGKPARVVIAAGGLPADYTKQAAATSPMSAA